MPFFVWLAIPLLFDWKVLKSEHFTVMYRDDVSWQAYQVLQQAEIHKPYIDQIVGNSGAHLPLVVEDIGMYANGFADPFMNHIHLYPYSPGTSYSIEGTENWLRTVTVHEYTHGAHLTLACGGAGLLQRLFGSVFNPNMYSPGWLIEGMAVYTESYISPYEGRLNEGFYDSYLQTLANKNDFPSIVDITNQPLQFPRDTHYLYGGTFFDFLAERYGVERFARFAARYGSYFWAPVTVFFPCIGIDAAARHAYGKSFKHLYDEWRRSELMHEKSSYGPAEQLTDDGWYIHALAGHQSTLYYVRSTSSKIDAFDVRTYHEIVAYDATNDRQTVLKSLPTSTITPLRIHNGQLYYTTREVQFGMANTTFNGFGFVHVLNRIDLATHKTETLLTGKMRAFCVISNDSILFSMDQEKAYGSTLWIMTPIDRYCVGVSDMLIEELLYAHGYVVAIGKPEFANTDIYAFDMENGSFTRRVASPWSEAFLQPAEHGRIGFTSNIMGNHALYELDLCTDAVERIAIASYARNGIRLEGSPDTCYFVGITTHGFDIFRTPIRLEPNNSAWDVPSQASAPSLAEIPLYHGSYSDIIATLLPRVRVPMIIPAGTDLRTWYLGGLFIGQDAVQENTYYAFLAYDPDARKPYLRLQWQGRSFSPLVADVYYENERVQYGASVPVYSRLRYGLNNVSVFISGQSFDNYTRIEVSPGIALALNYPLTTVRCALALPYERIAWGSFIDRHAQYARIAGQQVLANGSLKCTFTAFSDPDDHESQKIELRGTDPLLAQKGFGVKTEYVHRLFPLRWGQWNPNFFIEDVFAALFFDYGRSSDGNDAFSFGIEVRPELKLGFGYLQLTPCAGCARTNTNEFAWYIRFTSYTSAPYLRFVDPL
ncbi:hypothetical protein JXB22_03740 [candidate division WOR-3 bacterium]|nr:hypothetical protein [candidate division WOR-3 bacterium]